MKTTILKHALDHIIVPVDEYQLYALRNLVFCGFLTFVVFIVGLGQFMIFAGYMLAIALVSIGAWFYTLGEEVRRQVMQRVGDVVTMFWRACVDESFGDMAEVSRADKDDTEPEPLRRKPGRDVAKSSSGSTDTETEQVQELSKGFKEFFD